MFCPLFYQMEKLVALVSGGIDSPVSAYLMMQKFEVVILHYDNSPYTTDENERRAMKVIRKLEDLANHKLKTYIVPHGHVLTAILKNCPRKLTCVLCRRMMFRVAEKIAEKENAKGLVTGEVLGQHATQTLQNLAVTDLAIQLPILRPLLTFDKNEIVELGRELGIYGEQIRPAGCCTAVPKRPRTKASMGEVLFAEDQLDIESLVKRSLENVDLGIQKT